MQIVHQYGRKETMLRTLLYRYTLLHVHAQVYTHVASVMKLIKQNTKTNNNKKKETYTHK